MQYFLDISLVLLIAVTVIIYWKRGLIRSMMGAAKTVLSVILTYMFGDAARDWIYLNYMQPSVRSFVHGRLEEMATRGEGVYDLSGVVEVMPDWLKTLLHVFHVDVGALQEQYASVNTGSYEQLEDFVVSISDPVVSFLSAVLGYALVFLVSALVLTIVAFIMAKLADLPLIRGCDRALGLVLGILCAILYGSLYVLLTYALLGWIEVNHPELGFTEGFASSLLFKFAYEWNLFKILFGF